MTTSDPYTLPQSERYGWIRQHLSIMSWIERYHPTYAAGLMRLNTPGARFNGPCFGHKEEKGNALLVDEVTGRVVCYGECGWKGIDLTELEYIRAAGSKQAACERLLSAWQKGLLRTKETACASATHQRTKRESPINTTQTGPRPVSVWDWREQLRSLTVRQRQTLASQRGLKTENIREAERRGLLYAIRSLEGWAWLITDGERQTASWRLFSGQPWRSGRVKAKCLPGSKAASIIGVREALQYDWAVLVEGGPDLLAAMDVWFDLGVVCALSANSRFDEQQLTDLKEAEVGMVICAHNDASGRKAAAEWERQLRSVRIRVRHYDLHGHKDLNNYVRSAAE
jgi:hypothetical protein